LDENKAAKRMIGKIFGDIAEAIETGSFAPKIKIGITTMGSEHGIRNIVKGAEAAARKAKDFDVVLIGPETETDLEICEARTEDEMYKKMEELLDSGYLQGVVTMHYDFPIGVSTVGKVITPGTGKEMFLATTTGTSSLHRTEAMVKNALYGIITAKAMGIKEPSVGILNLDGSRQVEKALKTMDGNGYKINFAESVRADGGVIMRGNDLLTATPDIMVTDTLTGNLLMKIFSSFSSGGNYESLGYGYGPGIGEGYKRIVMIISRASGAPVAANAIEYAAELVRGGITDIASAEFEKARAAKLDDILASLTKEVKQDKEEITAPPKEIVTEAIAGIDVLDIEDAEKTLWKAGIYAESGMGCTGPIIRINSDKVDAAKDILIQSGYICK